MTAAGPAGPDRTRVRTFHARRGRRSALTESRLAGLVPGLATPATVLTPPGTLGRPERVVVEVGCGHGAAALGYAAAYPGHHLVACDVHPPGVARLAAAAVEQGRTNLSVHLGDAVPLLAAVPAGSIDAVHLFFPDPWPKTRHARRRFVSAPTLDLLDRILVPGGEIRVATDQSGYAAWVREQVARHGGWLALAAPRPWWRPVAGYEAKGLAAGRPAIDLVLRRPAGR